MGRFYRERDVAGLACMIFFKAGYDGWLCDVRFELRKQANMGSNEINDYE